MTTETRPPDGPAAAAVPAESTSTTPHRESRALSRVCPTPFTPLPAPVTQRSVSAGGALVHSSADQPTVFPAPIANLVTTLATSARLSLRVTAFFIEAILETSQYGTRVSLGYTRRLLITAISSARRVYLASNAAMDGDLLGAIGLGGAEGSDNKFALSTSTDAFLNVLDRWTNLGIYVIHHTFTLAELFAMSGFYLTANTIQSATHAAHESVALLDSLFGSNETSRALASIITLVRKELLEDERFQAADRGKVAAFTALTRALTAFACLQNATWESSSSRLKMRVLYDCVVVTSNDETFSTNQETQRLPLPLSEERSIGGPGPSTMASRQRAVTSISTTDADGDVDMKVTVASSEASSTTPSSVATSPVVPRPPQPARQNSYSRNRRSDTSPDLELLWQLEDLVGESGDDQLDAGEATPDGRRQRLLKRVRDDMYEITDELSESTIVTQTLERVATGPYGRDRQRTPAPSIAGGDVSVEAIEDSGLASTATATTATSVCDPDDENDWIEVDNLLDEDDQAAMSTTSGGASPRSTDSTERIQLVLRTMTNKLLQRKRTVRRVQGVGLGVNMTRIGSPSPPPERLRSRSSTPVADRDRSDRQIEYGVSGPSGGAVRQRTPPPGSSSSTPSPSKGKGRRRPPPLGEGARRPSIVGAAGNAIRSALRPSSQRSTPTPPPREPFPRDDFEEVHSPPSVPRPPPPSPYVPTSSSSRQLPSMTPATTSYSPSSTNYTPPSNSGYPSGIHRTVSVSESVRTRSNRIHASASQIFSPNAEAAETLFPHEGLIRNIHRFCRYSSAAYGQNFLRIFGLGNSDIHFPNTGRHHANSWAFAQHTNIPIDALLLSSWTETTPQLVQDKAPPLVHYIAVEHHLKAIVLTCRGTLGLSDVLVDLTCDYQDITVEGGDPHASYYVHSGMYQSALQLTEKCSRVHQTLVEALEKYPDYGLVLCGHSLGGGVAALLAIECSVKADVFRAQNAARSRPARHPPISTPFVTSFASGLPPGRPIHCYAYGIPAVASADLAKHASGLISSVVQNDDVVPTLSLGVLRDLKNIAVTLYEEAGVAEEIVGRIVGLYRRKFAFQTEGAVPPDPTGRLPSDEQITADWMMSLIKTMRADMDNNKLFPPGAVYIMEYFDVFVTDEAVLVGNGAAVSNKQAQRVILRQCESVEERFREPLFSRTMLNDHMPSHYERSTQLLYEGLGQGLL